MRAALAVDSDNECAESGASLPDRARLLSDALQAVADLPAATRVAHAPLIALFMKLQPMSGTAAIAFRSAHDVCRDVVGGLSLAAQMRCLGGILHTLVRLHSAAAAVDDSADSLEREDAALVASLVRPARIVRTGAEEPLLALAVSCLKSDAFLAPFIELQHRVAAARFTKKNNTKSGGNGNVEDGGGGGGDDEGDGGGEAAVGLSADADCAELLGAALEAHSHYSGPSAAAAAAAAEGDGAETTRLLADNALACVLAAVNEPTFVRCQQRLLLAPGLSLALQARGLRTLLDRLHQSLPTTEFESSAADAEDERRAARDPRLRLPLAALVRLRARPLTTRRTFALFPPLLAMFEGAIASACASARSERADNDDESAEAEDEDDDTGSSAAAAAALFSVAQLALACLEELVRIVGGGGSVHAGANLLGAGGGGSTTTAHSLLRCFGSKASLGHVHAFTAALIALLDSATAASSSSSSSKRKRAAAAARPRHLSPPATAVLASAATALATVAQTLGANFLAAQRHTEAALRSLTRAASLVSGCGCGGGEQQQQQLFPAAVRHALLVAVVRVLPATWTMAHPFVPALLAAATAHINVGGAAAEEGGGGEATSEAALEVVVVLEALLEPRVLLECCCACLRPPPESSSAASSIAIGYATHSFPILFACVARLLQRLPKDAVAALPIFVSAPAEVGGDDGNFWLAALGALANERPRAGAGAASQTLLPASDVLDSVFHAYRCFFIKFKARHCLRFLTTLVDWAFASPAAAAALALAAPTTTSSGGGDALRCGPAAVVRWCVVLRLVNALLQHLGPLLHFAMPLLTGPLVGLLAAHCASTGGATRHASGGGGEGVTAALEAALECARRMATAQAEADDGSGAAAVAPHFAAPEVLPTVARALVGQLANTAFLADEHQSYRQRVDRVVIPAVRALFRCVATAGQKARALVQGELLRLLRSPHHGVRRSGLAALRGVYEDGGGELASVVGAELLPAAVEATDDGSAEVAEEARLLCNELSAITGQDVLYAMT